MSNERSGEGPILKKFAANTGWLVAQNVFQYVLSAVIGIIAARYMGPSNYGVLGYGAALMLMFTPLCNLSLNDVQIPCMIDAPDDVGRIIGSSVVMRLVSTLLSIAAMLALVSIMKPGNRLLLVVTALQSLQLIVQVCDSFRLWFQMKLMSKYTAVGSVIGNVACSIWRIALLIRGASVEWFALTSAIQMLASYLFVLPMFSRVSGVRLGFSFEVCRRLLRRGFHLILAGITSVITARVGAILLGNLLNETALGVYNAALNIATMWIFVPQALVDSAMPVLLETNKTEPDAFWPRYQALHLSILAVSVLAGLGLTVLADWVIDFLYGPAYAASANLLRILAWAGVFINIGTARNIWTLALDKQRYIKYFCIIAAVCSVSLNYLLIRWLGLTGAAIANLAVQAVQALGAPLFFGPTREFVAKYFGCFRQAPQLKIWLTQWLEGRKHRGA